LFCHSTCPLKLTLINTEAGGFALEQTLHVVTLAVFSYVDLKVASAYIT
jgi:hypothetical protein